MIRISEKDLPVRTCATAALTPFVRVGYNHSAEKAVVGRQNTPANFKMEMRKCINSYMHLQVLCGKLGIEKRKPTHHLQGSI